MASESRGAITNLIFHSRKLRRSQHAQGHSLTSPMHPNPPPARRHLPCPCCCHDPSSFLYSSHTGLILNYSVHVWFRSALLCHVVFISSSFFLTLCSLPLLFRSVLSYCVILYSSSSSTVLPLALSLGPFLSCPYSPLPLPYYSLPLTPFTFLLSLPITHTPATRPPISFM